MQGSRSRSFPGLEIYISGFLSPHLAYSIGSAELFSLLLGAQVASVLRASPVQLGSASLLAVQHLHKNLSQVPWQLRSKILELKHLQDTHAFKVIKIPPKLIREALSLATTAR
ncbi:unnamed protein product, partial [Urochloa humidicola]